MTGTILNILEMFSFMNYTAKHAKRTQVHSWWTLMAFIPSPTPPQPVYIPGMTHTSMLTLEYMAPLRTSPLRIQMIDAAGLALSAWQVRLRGSPALRLTTGPPPMTGSSGGTVDRDRQGAWWPCDDKLLLTKHVWFGWMEASRYNNLEFNILQLSSKYLKQSQLVVVLNC